MQQVGSPVIEEDRYVPDVVEEGAEESSDSSLGQFDIVASPNDFNVVSLVEFMEQGVLKVPGFQRNYVWDIRRASKFIESILIGLPIPQIFLYEQERNKFLVIDGQQRLMSLYYFVKERFPRKDKLIELRQLFDERGKIPGDVLDDPAYFTDFRLNLPDQTPGNRNQFSKFTYSTLGEQFETSFKLRTIRNIIIKQFSPAGHSSMFEIFTRLNSGGVNLTAQEIRRSMYDSAFYDALYKTNATVEWRTLVGSPIPDLRMKDVEVLLRGFAMLMMGDSYRPPLVSFLNTFSESARHFGEHKREYLAQLLQSFLNSCSNLPEHAFQTGGRFSPMVYESVFVAMCTKAYDDGGLVIDKIDPRALAQLKDDEEFSSACQSATTAMEQVKTRLSRAGDLLSLAA